jgi:TonB family protein
MKGVRSVLLMMCLSLSVASGKQATGARGGQELFSNVVTDFLSAEEASDVQQRLGVIPEFPLRMNQPNGVWVEILEANIKAVKRNPRYYSTDESISNYVTDHLMQVHVRLRNNTANTVAVVSLRLFHSQSGSHFYIKTARGPIEPGAIEQIRIPLMAIADNPAGLILDVVRVTFADKTMWQEPASDRSVIPLRRLHNPDVDVKPRPLNRFRPEYTPLARANQVSGVVRLYLSVAADGSVRKVEVINSLPDGLTELAIKIARVLQFQPAMRQGKPVAYTVPLDVEFVRQ